MNYVKFTRCHQEAHMEWRLRGLLSAPADGSRNALIPSQTFNFAETTWRLVLDCELSDKPEMERFTFTFIEPCKYCVSYSFSLKHPNGSLVQIASGFMESRQENCENHYIKLKKTVQQTPEFASADVITIEGSMQAGYFKEPNVESKEPPSKKLRRLDKLSTNLERLFTDQLNCDVSLQVKDKKYQVHKAILIAQSPVFAAMFQDNTSENQTGIINVSDCDPESFKTFLKYLYCGKVEELNYSSALNLYVTSKKYNVEELNTFCRVNLIDNLELNTWCDLYAMGDLYEDKKLKNASQEFFDKNLLQIFKTPKWENFVKDNHQLASKLLKEIPEQKIAK